MLLKRQSCSLSGDTLVSGSNFQKTYLVSGLLFDKECHGLSLLRDNLSSRNRILGMLFEKCSQKRAYRLRVNTNGSPKPWFLLCMFFSISLTLMRYAFFFRQCCSLSCDTLIFNKYVVGLTKNERIA